MLNKSVHVSDGTTGDCNDRVSVQAREALLVHVFKCALATRRDGLVTFDGALAAMKRKQAMHSGSTSEFNPFRTLGSTMFSPSNTS